MNRKWLLAAVLMLGSGLTGCAVRSGYVAIYGPPPPRYGMLGVAPGPGYVWTDGYYDWRGRNWVWMDGRWARPPRAGMHWEPRTWYRHGNGYRARGGHWRR